MPTTQPTIQPNAKKPSVYLLSTINVAKGGDNAPRQFSGIANSGKPFMHEGEKTIIDLSDIRYQEKVPALVEHERGKRAGFGMLAVENNQLVIKGMLLNNEFGNEVAADADAGFPWQMSAHVIPNKIDVLTEGTSEVNGQTVTAPITILRQCRIPEVSFTPTGVDDQTHAVVLSDDGSSKPPTHQPSNTLTDTQDNAMTIEELQELLENEQVKNAELVQEIETLTAKNAELEAMLSKTEAQANVDAQLSQAGFSKSDDGKWQGISDATYNVLLSQSADHARAMIGDLKLSRPTAQHAPDYLFGEQHKPTVNSQGNVQLSDNPLVANAQSRGQAANTFI